MKTLFDPPSPSEPMRAPGQAHSKTSMAAARAIEGKSDSIRGLVYRTFLGRVEDGVTDDELFNYWPSQSQSPLRPRRIELVKLGLVKDSGKTRKTRSGRQAVIWVAVE